MKINMMCGTSNFGDSWLHYDQQNLKHIQHHDVTKLPNFDNTIELIYCSHGITYFDRQQAKEVLAEWYRVLLPNGILRLAVPDFEVMSRLYQEGKFSLDSFLGPLYGRQEYNGKLNYHKTTYDFTSLSELLISAGFRNIRKWDWRQIEPHNKIDDCSKAYLPKDNDAIKNMSWNDKDYTLISLNVECDK